MFDPSGTHLARNLLIKARDQFQFYGDQHSAKIPPQVEKAKVNYALVAELNLGILALANAEVASKRVPDIDARP